MEKEQPPPAYPADSEREQLSEKQPQQAVPATAPVSTASTSNGPQELIFNFYQAPGLFNKDLVITGPDKQESLYVLDFQTTGVFGRKWDLRLRQRAKDGPVVCQISGSAQGDACVTMANGWKTEFVKTSITRNKREFIAFDGQTHYGWQPEGVLSSDYICVNLTTKEQVASWRSTGMALSKDGVLTIRKRFEQETELILATSIALEVGNKERRRRRGARAGAAGGS